MALLPPRLAYFSLSPLLRGEGRGRVYQRVVTLPFTTRHARPRAGHRRFCGHDGAREPAGFAARDCSVTTRGATPSSAFAKATARAHQRTGEIASIRPDPDGRGPIAPALLIDFGLYESCQVSQRLLPAEITGLRRNDVRDAFLHDAELRADRHFLQRHRHHNLAGEARIVEFVRVAQAFVRNELDIFAAK